MSSFTASLSHCIVGPDGISFEVTPEELAAHIAAQEAAAADAAANALTGSGGGNGGGFCHDDASQGGAGAGADEVSDDPIANMHYSIFQKFHAEGICFARLPPTWRRFITDMVIRKGGLEVPGGTGWTGRLIEGMIPQQEALFLRIFAIINEAVLARRPGNEENDMRESCEKTPTYQANLTTIRTIMGLPADATVREIHIGNNNAGVHLHHADGTPNTSTSLDLDSTPIGCTNMTPEKAYLVVSRGNGVLTNAVGNATLQVVELGTDAAAAAFAPADGDSAFVTTCKTAARDLNEAVLRLHEGARPRIFVLPRGALCDAGDFTNVAWPQRAKAPKGTITRDIGTGSIKEKDSRKLDAKGKPIEVRIPIPEEDRAALLMELPELFSVCASLAA
jgi:hypothetical protein